MVSRFLTAGPLWVKEKTGSVSVTALIIFFLIMLGSSVRAIWLLGSSLLLIFLVGLLRDMIRAVFLLIWGLGIVSIDSSSSFSKRLWKRRAMSRASSMCWTWSSPTGTMSV